MFLQVSYIAVGGCHHCNNKLSSLYNTHIRVPLYFFSALNSTFKLNYKLKLFLSEIAVGSVMSAGAGGPDWFMWVTEGLLLLAVGGVGLAGNACSVVVFARQRIQRVFHHLLLMLAIFDGVRSRSYCCPPFGAVAASVAAAGLAAVAVLGATAAAAAAAVVVAVVLVSAAVV